MKKTVATLLIAAAAMVGTPAFAQAAGTVVINGTVAEKCSATNPLNDTIDLGELAQSDGTVDPNFSKHNGGLSRMFTVRCNGSNPQISVNAKPLIHAAGTEADGYTNIVGYTATIVAKHKGGGGTPVSDKALHSGATKAPMTGRLLAEANNVTLTIGDGITSNSTAILEAGSYTGSVDITIGAAL